MEIRSLLAAKIDRATELVSTLEAELDAYKVSQPTTFKFEHNADEHAIVSTVESVRQPPLRLSVIAGEIIHDLRSALDHLVWQLALLRTDEPSERLQFPIYTERPKDWRSIAGDRLASVPPEAIDQIERLQPYHAEVADVQALAVLQALSNEDKHRLLLDFSTVQLQFGPEHFEISGVNIADELEIEGRHGVLVAGFQVAVIRYTPIGPKPHLEITGTMPTDIGLGRIGFRVAMLPDLAGEVTRHLRSFEHFFDTASA